MVDSGGFFTPYVEAPVIKPSFPSTHISGTDTSEIDHLRQGIEVTTDKYRYIGTLPKLGTGQNDAQLSVIVFGQSAEFRANIGFEELVDFDPVLYIQDQNALIFPVVLTNASFDDPERFGGFIEPLSLGSRDLLLSTTEFEAHDVRGHLQGGNEDSFRKTDFVVQFLNNRERIQTRDLFIDANEIHAQSGSIISPSFFPEQEKLLDPFDDRRGFSRCFSSGTLSKISSLTIRGVVLNMTGATTDTYIPDTIQSLGTGFTYDFTIEGTDSLAFGGYKRS